MTRRQPSTRLHILALLAAAAFTGACESDSDYTAVIDSAPKPILEPADFRRAPGDASPTAPEFAAKAPSKTDIPAPTTAPSGAIPDAIAVAATPRLDTLPDAKPVGDAVFVDAIVGQINGKPVYASKVLNKMDRRLRAEANKKITDREWLQVAARLIAEELNNQIRDELFLAEARSALSPDERRGFLQFVTRLRENLASSFYGSETFADDRLLAEEGKTLEELATEERDKSLIRILVNRHIVPRVNVAWRDVQKEYDRSFSTYNPLPTAKMRMIWVPLAPTKDEAAATKVADQLKSGRAFDEIAADRTLNGFVPGEGGAIEKTFEGDYASAPNLLVGEKANALAQSLQPGQFGGPVEWTADGGRVFLTWVKLDAIEQPPGVPLEDAQLTLANRLRAVRFEAEARRYFDKLQDRGSRTDIRLMTERLLQHANERILVPERAKQAEQPAPK